MLQADFLLTEGADPLPCSSIHWSISSAERPQEMQEMKCNVRDEREAKCRAALTEWGKAMAAQGNQNARIQNQNNEWNG